MMNRKVVGWIHFAKIKFNTLFLVKQVYIESFTSRQSIMVPNKVALWSENFRCSSLRTFSVQNTFLLYLPWVTHLLLSACVHLILARFATLENTFHSNSFVGRMKKKKSCKCNCNNHWKITPCFSYDIISLSLANPSGLANRRRWGSNLNPRCQCTVLRK